jgi:Spy/CpxP family protein refolding chaperone
MIFGGLMKNKINYIMITVFTLVTLCAFSAMAKEPCPVAPDNTKKIEMKRGMPDKFMDMELTAEQNDKMDKMMTDHRKKMIRLRADLEIARIDKMEMIKDRNFQKDKLQKQVKKIMAIETNMEMARIDMLAQARTILTDEQWKVFSDRQKHRRHGKIGPRG